MSQAELREKFLGLATTCIARDRAERVVEVVERLEELDDAGTLMNLLSPPEPGR